MPRKSLPKTKLGKRINFEAGAAKGLRNARKKKRNHIKLSDNKQETREKWNVKIANMKDDLKKNRDFLKNN